MDGPPGGEFRSWRRSLSEPPRAGKPIWTPPNAHSSAQLPSHAWPAAAKPVPPSADSVSARADLKTRVTVYPPLSNDWFFRNHGLSIFLLITAIAWVVLFSRLDPNATWGPMVRNIVSDWTQIFGTVLLAKSWIEPRDKL
jgi:hypothetical protein